MKFDYEKYRQRLGWYLFSQRKKKNGGKGWDRTELVRRINENDPGFDISIKTIERIEFATYDRDIKITHIHKIAEALGVNVVLVLGQKLTDQEIIEKLAELCVEEDNGKS